MQVLITRLSTQVCSRSTPAPSSRGLNGLAQQPLVVPRGDQLEQRLTSVQSPDLLATARAARATPASG